MLKNISAIFICTDEGITIPTPRSEKLALRTQQIIAHESGVINTIDPLAGSYYVETLTDRMEAECKDYFEEIEALGGVIPAIETGFFQRAIADSAYRYQREIEEKKRIIVGLNEFVEDEAAPIDVRRPDPAFEEEKVAALISLKRNRDQGPVRTCLNEITEVIQGPDNVMPVLIRAVKAQITLGEIINVMKKVFGEYREQAIY